MEKNSNKKLIGAIIAIVVVIAAMAAIFFAFKPATASGSKAVTIEVVDPQGASSSYSVKTDAEYLSQVFDEIDDLSVEGSQGDYGLYIETVNGDTADYSVDGAYWAIYVNGEYGQYAADAQPVNDGDTFSLNYECYVAE